MKHRHPFMLPCAREQQDHVTSGPGLPTPVPRTSSPDDSSSSVMTLSCSPKSRANPCSASAHSPSVFHRTRHPCWLLSSHCALPGHVLGTLRACALYRRHIPSAPLLGEACKALQGRAGAYLLPQAQRGKPHAPPCSASLQCRSTASAYGMV